MALTKPMRRALPFAALVEDRMQTRKLTVRHLAAALRMTTAQVYQMLTGGSLIATWRVRHLAAELDVPVERLLDAVERQKAHTTVVRGRAGSA